MEGRRKAPASGQRKLWKVFVLVSFSGHLVLVVAGGFIFGRASTSAHADREGHHRARRFCQQHGRSGVRRHAEDGAQRLLTTSRRFLNVLSDNKVAEDVETDDSPARYEAHARSGAGSFASERAARLTLSGRLRGLGSEYVLGLKAVNCRSGDPLGEKQVTAASKEKVLDALGNAASKLRGELGESLATVQKFDVPLVGGHYLFARSAEGVQLWRKEHDEKGSAAALTYLQRAIELDPKFAMGYRGCGQRLLSLGQDGAGQRVLHERHSNCENMPASGKSSRSPPTTMNCNRGIG